MSADYSQSAPIIVSFSGIDGAGKSTQIANLCAFLESAGFRIKLVAFWDDVATLKPLREGAGHKILGGDKGVGSPDAPIERRDKNVRSPLMTIVRLGLYTLDTLSLGRSARRARQSEANVVIFDRFIYDEFANLDLSSPVMRAYVRLLNWLAPHPDVSFFLDADPVAARLRKPEYPLQFLRENREAYLRLSRFLDGITVIPPLPLDRAKTAVVRQFLSRMTTRSSKTPANCSGSSEAVLMPKMQEDEPAARPLAS